MENSPASYTPQHLVDRILSFKSAMVGERKNVTVLFADIVGSLQLIADRDPEEASDILDPALSLMMEAIHAYEGTITQIAGDGLMALFGAPLSHEDHALRACLAALKIQQDVARFASHLRQQHGADVQVRIGLNCGEVVFRSIQSNLSMEYTAIGQTVHLAARMEQLARPGTILITEAVRRQILGPLSVRPLGEVPVKGLPAPIAVFQLESARRDVTRLQIAREQGRLSSFVGRSAELASLRQALERAVEGHGQIVALVGEPGVGKSRLAFEVAQAPEALSCLTLEAHALSYGTQTAYLPLVALLRSYFELELASGTVVGGAEIRERVTQRVTALDPELADILPAILWLFDFAEGDDDWTALDPLIKRQRTLDAFKRLLLAESRRHPLLLIFEDLHWIDRETQTVLDALVEIVPAAPILMLLSYRPEYEHSWGGRTFYRQITVGPLAPDATYALLDALLGEDPSIRPLKELVAERTEGNPFFLEETLRSLMETGALVGQNSIFRAGNSSSQVLIPRSVQAVLAARIDRLGPPDKRLLQAASVVGKDVSYALLADMMDGSSNDLDAVLHRLQASEFLYQTGVAPKAYSFKHGLTHDVAYECLLKEQRGELHARAMHSIERLYEGRLDEHVEALARHALQGENWEKAVAYLRRAGLAAAKRSSFREAEAWYRQALVALARLSQTPTNMRLGVDLRLELYTALIALGDHAPVFSVLEDARKLAAVIGTDSDLARIEGYLAHTYWWTADYQTALEHAEISLALSDKLQRPGLKLLGLIAKGWVHKAQGRLLEAKSALNEALAITQSLPRRRRAYSGEPLVSVVVLAWLASCASDAGDFDEGERAANEAVQRAEEADHPWSRVCAYHALGSLLTNRGHLPQAIAALERGQRICTSQGVRAWAMSVAWELGHAYVLSGDLVRGASTLEESVRQADADHCLTGQAVRVAWLAEAEYRSGHVVRGVELGERALKLAREHRELSAEAEALRILGDFAAATGDQARQVDCHRGALSIASAQGLRPLEARCHLALARAANAGMAEATTSLATATELATSMGMVVPTLDATT